jgi:hypothetical protein
MTESTGSEYFSIGNMSWKNGKPIRRAKAIMAKMISPHSLMLYFSDNEHLTQNEEQAKLLMTVPRVDYCAAMILLSEIGDVKRFASPGKLVSWVGLAPQVHQSGETH